MLTEYKFWLSVAIVSSVLFIIKIVMMLFINTDHALGDFDHHLDSSDAFEVLSLQSILAFIMSASWMGLTFRYQWNYSLHLSMLGASIFGLIILFLFSYMMKNVKKLNHKTHASFVPEVGLKGTVYLTIPGHGHGNGKIQIVTDGRLNVIDAIQYSQNPIESHASIEVVDSKNNIVVVKRTN